MTGNQATLTTSAPITPRPAGLAGNIALRRGVVIALLALTLGFLTLYPLLMLMYGSFYTAPPGEAGTFSLDGYRRIMTGENLAILGNTVMISLTKTVLSLIVASALAFLIARTDVPLRGPLEILITLPFFIPPILTAMAWGMLANPSVGVVNHTSSCSRVENTGNS